MSEIHAEIHGEWWWLAGVVTILIPLLDLPDNVVPVGQVPMLSMFRNPTPTNIFELVISLEIKAPDEQFMDDWNGERWRIVGYGIGVLGKITLTGQEEKTEVAIVTSPALLDYWNHLIRRLQNTAHTVRLVRSTSTSDKFEQIITAYYEALERNEKPNLRRMADAAGVNYASLRQFKFRYDKNRTTRPRTNNLTNNN